MRYIILLFLVLVGEISLAQTNDTLYFKSERALLEYAFQNTDLPSITNGLFANYWRSADEVLSVLDTLSNRSVTLGDDLYQMADILDRMDLTGDFDKSELVFPFFDHIHTLDYERKMKLPVFCMDVNIHALNPVSENLMDNWSSENPLPAFYPNNLDEYGFFFGVIPADTIPYENVSLIFASEHIRTNTGRTLESIDINVNGVQTSLTVGQELDLSTIAGDLSVEITYKFDDGSSETSNQKFFKTSSSALPKSGFWSFIDTKQAIRLKPSQSIYIDNPEVQYAVKYGCNEGVIRKPFFVCAGWAPYANVPSINEALEWPSDLIDFAVNTANQEGFVENLNAAGYDVVLMKFFPPNASIIKNSELMERLINQINQEKFNNNSFEENIVMGYSAGALCAKYTLTRMEKKYWEQSAPHPHTKLYVSFDGENGGANIPLGLQHHVDYLYDYEHSNNVVWLGNPNISPGAVMYALKYILDAPLSQELLTYHHSMTGTLDNPGQGASPSRNGYLYAENQSNHYWTAGNPNYPAFSRNISIANGSSEPNINLSSLTSNHYPYPAETGAIYYQKTSPNHQWQARFGSHGLTSVFSYKSAGMFGNNWEIKYAPTTKNPLVMDNAPGGIIFIETNPLVKVIKVMNFETLLYGSPEIERNHLFSFTPTILVHDILNYNPLLDDFGYLNYNFKTAGLNYDNLAAAASDNPISASNSIGFPHLYYPTNHYSITPFDALFTWNENTVHVTSGRKSQNYYEEEWSPARGMIKNFIVEEGDHWNVFLQDDIVGKEGEGIVDYRVDYVAQNSIYIGQNVTEKRAFEPIIFSTHANVVTMAAEEISIKEGFHAKRGTEWHAVIGEVSCTKRPEFFDAPDANEGATSSAHLSEESYKMLIFPNPTRNEFKISVHPSMSENVQMDFYIFDLSGNLLKSGQTQAHQLIDIQLHKGIYLVEIKYNETWHTEKLIVQ